MNEHHYQRIDKGVKRIKPNDIEREARQQARNDKGKFLPVCSAEKRSQIILEALDALQAGEPTNQIAARHNLSGRTLRSWLIALPEADQARALMIANELSSALEKIETAKTPMPLARARELFRGWSWIGERRLPAFYGQKQEVTHNIKPEFTVILKPEPMSHTGVMSNPNPLISNDLTITDAEIISEPVKDSQPSNK